MGGAAAKIGLNEPLDVVSTIDTIKNKLKTLFTLRRARLVRKGAVNKDTPTLGIELDVWARLQVPLVGRVGRGKDIAAHSFVSASNTQR